MIKAVILDLDDTLYDERDYVLSGFQAVAGEIARRFPAVEAERVYGVMVAELDAHGRGKVFDRALEHAGIAPTSELVRALVEVYRDHRPRIALWPGVADVLGALAQTYRTAIVTDGLARMQRRKVDALGVESMVAEVLFCWEHEAPKPDPACYIEALRRLDAKPEEAVVIGDNPGHDMAAASAIGARSIRVLTGRFATQGDAGFTPDATVGSVLDAAKVLRDEGFGAPA